MAKIAFVTGASRGIGRAVAERLAEEGWAVGLNYLRSRSGAEDLVQKLSARGLTAAAVQGDVADQAAITAAIRQAEEQLGGGVSLLVNCAGIARQCLFQEMSSQEWRQLFAVNADGPFHAIQAVLPGMIREKAGCIVNIASIWGLRGASCEVAYSASKAAVIGLTRSLAAELAPSGIRVNCVAPGVINTDMVASLGEDTLRQLAEDTPLGRLGTPEDIAFAVSFLADPRAAFITGQVLTADGGFTL